MAGVVVVIASDVLPGEAAWSHVTAQGARLQSFAEHSLGLQPRVEISPRQAEDFKVLTLHSVYIRYRLPMRIELQCFEWTPGFDAARVA